MLLLLLLLSGDSLIFSKTSLTALADSVIGQ
jgi:hypothetical protein